MIIDAHQHFWTINRGDYGWLTPKLKPLYRDFSPEDLTPLLHKNNIEGTVLIQAAPTVAETHYLLQLASSNDFIKGVIGWADFEANDVVESITELAKQYKLVGLRPMIQDIADDDWMLQPKLVPAFESMIENNLVFEALTLPRHLPNLAELLARHPNLSVVINHGSKPDIAGRKFAEWSTHMSNIANDSSVFIKLSGLVTEADSDWSVDDLKPFVNHLLDCFGPQRVIWGSDWPVCTLASTYNHWCDATKTLLTDLTDAERTSIMGGNAMHIYKLNEISS